MAIEPLSPPEGAPPPTTAVYDGFAYFQGKIVPFAQANVSIGTHALNYGTACFEGIRGYWNAEHNEIYLLKLAEHYRRFLKSAALAMIKVDLHSPDDAVAIFAMPMGAYARIDGLRVTISSWRRVSDNSIPARAK